MNYLIKKIIFLFLVLYSCNGFSDFSAGYATGITSGIAMASIASKENQNIPITPNFDYIMICEAKYSKNSKGMYEYYCPKPPSKNVIFMSTKFSDGWPKLIFYYMRNK